MPSIHRTAVAVTLWILSCVGSIGGRVLINAERIHLGEPGSPEWEWFENDPARPGPLELRFNATANAQEATLFIEQSDVKQDWRVHLNGKPIGKLFLMEEYLTSALALPGGALRDGENVLTIIPPISSTDDIVLHEITVDRRPLKEAVHEVTVEIAVRDSNGSRIPCRITVVDERDRLAPLVALAGEKLALRPGVIYTGTGTASIGLRSGRYKVHASRGFEYGIDTRQLNLDVGSIERIEMEIAHEVLTPGLVSCDTHIHTLELSGHGDATLDERMFTIAGEGIELPIATEHNRHADYSDAAKRTGMNRYFTPVRGNEVTTPVGHFNIFPVNADSPVPDAKITDWLELLKAMRATPGVRVILLNHPRSVHSKFIPFGPDNFDAEAGQSKGRIDFGFDGLEAINSGAQQSDFMLVFRDWFALLNRGLRLVAVGASDSHDVSRFIVGQGRTYIASDDTDPSHIDITAACNNLLAGRAYVSMGLLPIISVEKRFTVGDLATDLPELISVQVKVLGPSWIRAEKVELFANGISIRESSIDAIQSSRGGEKAVINWIIPRPAIDTYLVAMVSGPSVTAPHWAMSRPYQPSSPRWKGHAIGATNPVWLDADGDRHFKGPMTPPH